MKKRLFIEAICLSIAALISFFGCAEPQILGPRLAISEESWDFGTVKIGSELEYSIIIKNVGGAELNLYAYPNCPACMYLELGEYNVPPKGETELHIRIVEREAGPYEGFIIVTSNDPAQREKKLTVEGEFISESSN